MMSSEEGGVEDLPTIGAIIRRARANLSEGAWVYGNAGAGEEATVRRNRDAWGTYAFVPSVLRDVEHVNTSVELFGMDLGVPVLPAPVGSLSIFCPDGAAASALGADRVGSLAMIGTLSDPPFGEVQARSTGRNLFQLYVSGDAEWCRELVGRVEVAGARGICVTVDSPVRARRDRLLEVGFDWRMESDGVPPNLEGLGRDRRNQSRFTWAALAQLRTATTLPLALKGITNPRDARRAVDAGVDAIYVSNHGGRELDHNRAALESLPAVVAEVGAEVPILFDSGIRHGTDVCKALALGARAVLIGRLQCWGLAAGGAAGVARVLELLGVEIADTLALLGLRSPSELGPEHLTRDTVAVASVSESGG